MHKYITYNKYIINFRHAILNNGVSLMRFKRLVLCAVVVKNCVN